MKKTILLLTLICFAQITVMAQAKFGHMNSQVLLQAMPESASAETEMVAFRTQLEQRIQGLNAEYEKKYMEYSQLDASTPQSTIADLQNEIGTMENRIREYSVNAEKELMAKNEELLQPILTKLQDAISAVGKENGFTYIFDLSTGTIVYESGENIEPLVKAKLGI